MKASPQRELVKCRSLLRRVAKLVRRSIEFDHKMIYCFCDRPDFPRGLAYDIHGYLRANDTEYIRRERRLKNWAKRK